MLGGLCHPFARGGRQAVTPREPSCLFQRSSTLLKGPIQLRSPGTRPGGRGGQRGKRSLRLPTAKPAKVNTTWEDQCKLAEVVQEMGVSCKACLQGPFFHKPHESGPACYKYMISTGTVLPARGEHATFDVGELRQNRWQRPRSQMTELDRNLRERGRAKPWARYVRFETENGLALLYEPGPLDRWIGKNIRHDWRSRKFVDRETGEPLTVEEAKDYKRYIHRHNERRATGRSADKLVELVGKHNPGIEEELRIYAEISMEGRSAPG